MSIVVKRGEDDIKIEVIHQSCVLQVHTKSYNKWWRAPEAQAWHSNFTKLKVRVIVRMVKLDVTGAYKDVVFNGQKHLKHKIFRKVDVCVISQVCRKLEIR